METDLLNNLYLMGGLLAAIFVIVWRLTSASQKAILYRLEKVEHRLKKVEDRLKKVEDRLGKVEHRLGKVEDRLTKVEGGV